MGWSSTFVALVPPALRNRLLDALHVCGIAPFDERDWRELDILREQIPALHVDASATPAD